MSKNRKFVIQVGTKFASIQGNVIVLVATPDQATPFNKFATAASTIHSRSIRTMGSCRVVDA